MGDEKKHCSDGVIVGLGNPLLDISVHCDKNFLEKYEIKSNDAILAEEKHKFLFEDILKTYKNVQFIPGGACQNSIRVAQWCLGVPYATVFMGCINGDDMYGKKMKELCADLKVLTRYQYTNAEPTGTCAVLITDNNRSLVANLAAANLFSQTHLQLNENWSLVHKATFFYTTSFVLTVSPSSMLTIGKHVVEHSEKRFLLNLSAPFLCRFFKEPMMEVMPFVDVLFGNETEAATFAEVHEFHCTDISEIALKIACLPKKRNTPSRTVIITQGVNPTIVAKDGKVTTYEVKHVEESKIVDTNGAGDAFVGGFLAAFVRKFKMADCIAAGSEVSSLIIQRDGCTFDKAEKPSIFIN